MIGQTTIPVGAEEEFTFASFVAEKNRGTLDALVTAVKNPDHSIHYLWGPVACGKSHLLQACIELAKSIGRSFLFVNQSSFSSQALGHQDIPESAVLCFDDIERIAETEDASLVLLSWIEQAKQAGGVAVVSGTAPVGDISLGLPDLVSRFSAGASYRVESLSEAGLREALTRRSDLKGFELEPQVLEFILRRFPRDARSLFSLLDEIDRESLSSQRKITVPFVSSLIG